LLSQILKLGEVRSGVVVVAHLGALKFLPEIDSDHLRPGLIDSFDRGPDFVSVCLGLDAVEYMVRTEAAIMFIAAASSESQRCWGV
jgi:hypothetical protein